MMTFQDMKEMAGEVFRSGLFNMKSEAQTLTLMLVAQAEGRNPMEAFNRYCITNGRPTKLAMAIQSDFQESGGIISWGPRRDDSVEVTVSHPKYKGEFTCVWDDARVRKAELSGKDTHRKYGAQLKAARAITEAIRAVYPKACGIIAYAPEEFGSDEYISLPEPEKEKKALPEPEKKEVTEIKIVQEEKKTLPEPEKKEIPEAKKMVENIITNMVEVKIAAILGQEKYEKHKDFIKKRIEEDPLKAYESAWKASGLEYCKKTISAILAKGLCAESKYREILEKKGLKESADIRNFDELQEIIAEMEA